MITAATITANEYPLRVAVRSHAVTADIEANDTAPNPHDYFDTALATCKGLTAQWYAKRHGIPLERVETQVERDATGERAGVYKLRVTVAFFGSLTADQRQTLYRAIAACPVHKLMTTSDVQIEQLEA